jgi:hypothetical protein
MSSFPDRYKEAYTVEIADFVGAITSNKRTNVSKKKCLIGHIIAEASAASAVIN